MRFVQLLEYHCKTTCTDDDFSVMDGDRLVTDGMENGRVYAWFRGGGKYLRGWLPAAHVKELRFDRHPAYGKWQGTWMVGDARQIVIKAEPATNALAICASAEWHGGRLENGEQVIHTGEKVKRLQPEIGWLSVMSIALWNSNWWMSFWALKTTCNVAA